MQNIRGFILLIVIITGILVMVLREEGDDRRAPAPTPTNENVNVIAP
ncbi:MAG: hypothetical protein H6595_11800 [Flavobacteriales bacterium]|nr:hypothetical protein [Flavobacteriales bacterium]MCB9168144.1 hypothetical protein [Flavobacteriales bacterium]MCB9194291.1 hypothetical protein [Flavobacteriales bacterium]